MDLRTIADILLFRTWWNYHRPGQVSWVETPYHAFNLVEGSTWVVFAGLVLRRSLRRRPAPAEVGYALAFFTFGLTDFAEAYALTSWLLWIKGINLAALLWLRRVVIGRFYPTSKLY